MIESYVAPTEQLVVEIYVRDLDQSLAFFTDYGFEVARKETGFAVLKWEDSELYLEEIKDAPRVYNQVANIRVMVRDVDRYWEMAEKLGAKVVRPIADKYYGLRDFTIEGPDGVGLRFATRLADFS
jgi:catechol 2,3-dioxygenase-like lactoylglutathione lyase family enzyme